MLTYGRTLSGSIVADEDLKADLQYCEIGDAVLRLGRKESVTFEACSLGSVRFESETIDRVYFNRCHIDCLLVGEVVRFVQVARSSLCYCTIEDQNMVSIYESSMCGKLIRADRVSIKRSLIDNVFIEADEVDLTQSTLIDAYIKAKRLRLTGCDGVITVDKAAVVESDDTRVDVTHREMSHDV